MKTMGEALEQRAGNRLKPILESLTTRPIKGVVVGMVVTAVIQSSSATTVMLVGFVKSGNGISSVCKSENAQSNLDSSYQIF